MGLKRVIRKEALAASRRRPRKELGVPVADDRARLDNGRGIFKADQNHNRREHHCRRGRVHCHAERAMISIFVERVQMRHLHNGQKRQQSQTQQRGCPESAWLAAVRARILLKS